MQLLKPILSIRSTFYFWPALWLTHLLTNGRLRKVGAQSLTRLTIQARLAKEGRIRFRPLSIDQLIIEEVWGDQVYSHPEILALMHNGTVVDVGAHIGSFTLYAALRGHASRVVSFEPVPENFELLERNVKMNRLRNVQAFPRAVLDQSGISTLRGRNYNTGGYSFHGDGHGVWEVRTVTLESIFAQCGIEKCDVLKLDAEGSEYGILISAPEEILHRVTSITMEYHNSVPNWQDRLEEVGEKLTKNGFRVIPRSPSKDNNILYAIRSERN